ncbi:small ribosomal subunit protein uS7m-like [Rhipicephalus microplus]|uniref:small ribosomal subunit protein uS7m-like n=1 Tax=Rhipicephalus microplus TaxID=6941 RepID=UPI003F6B4604
MAASACESMIRSGSVVARKLCPVFATQVRTSVYDKNHVEPFVDKKKLEELETSGEVEDYKFVPVKAAPSHVSTSLFYDATLDKFINMLMRKGDKALARENIELGLFNVKRIQLTKYNRAADEETKSKVECNPVTILHKALENCRPVLELSPIKRGGITYQVPVPMTENRARFLSMKWMIDAVNDKDPKVAFCDQLAKELLDAYNNQGRVVKKKHELHKQCEANKAYAHYRWS